MPLAFRLSVILRVIYWQWSIEWIRSERIRFIYVSIHHVTYLDIEWYYTLCANVYLKRKRKGKKDHVYLLEYSFKQVWFWSTTKTVLGCMLSMFNAMCILLCACSMRLCVSVSDMFTSITTSFESSLFNCQHFLET